MTPVLRHLASNQTITSVFHCRLIPMVDVAPSTWHTLRFTRSDRVFSNAKPTTLLEFAAASSCICPGLIPFAPSPRSKNAKRRFFKVRLRSVQILRTFLSYKKLSISDMETGIKSINLQLSHVLPFKKKKKKKREIACYIQRKDRKQKWVSPIRCTSPLVLNCR